MTFSHVDTWVFDLDNTLYDAETGIFPRVAQRMTGFIADILKVSHDEANVLRHKYYKQYGTSMRGLMTEHQVDPDHFLDHVHDIDVSDVPQCDITIERLAHLPGRKIIFTNAPRRFAATMTRHLGIDHHFDEVFAIEDADYLPKPHIDTYQTVIKRFDIAPARACMFEDMAINLKPAAELGMTTVWIHGKGQNAAEDHPYVQHRYGKLSDWLSVHAKEN